MSCAWSFHNVALEYNARQLQEYSLTQNTVQLIVTGSGDPELAPGTGVSIVD